MNRTLVISALIVALTLAPSSMCLAQNGSIRSVAGSRPASAGILARLNRSRVPAMPGLPTISPLGLIAPRLSNLASIRQFGGVGTQAGRLGLLGLISPRLSPAVAIFTNPPRTPQAMRMYAGTILSPRLAVIMGMLKASRGAAGTLR